MPGQPVNGLSHISLVPDLREIVHRASQQKVRVKWGQVYRHNLLKMCIIDPKGLALLPPIPEHDPLVIADADILVIIEVAPSDVLYFLALMRVLEHVQGINLV